MNTYHRITLYCFVALVFSLILLATASAYDCGNPGSPTPVFWLRLNESTDVAGTIMDDVCGGNDFKRNSTTERYDGLWDGAQSFNRLQLDVVYNYSSSAMGVTTGNRTARVVIKTPAAMPGVGIDLIKVGYEDGTATKPFVYFYIDNSGKFHCWCGTGATYREIQGNSPATNTWYDMACIYNGSRLAIWQNASLSASIAATDCAGTNGTATVGAAQTDGQASFTGNISEAIYWNTDLNGTQLNALLANNTINEPAAGASSIGCSVAISSPADANRTNDSTPTVTGTLTCYQSMAGNCSLVMNATNSGINSTLSNGSSFEVTANTTKSDARYDYFLNCSNGTVSNSSSNRTLYIDSVPPSVSITYPTNTTYNTSVSLKLNFTYVENNTGTCWYNLNMGSNTTIGYVNNTALLAPGGVYTVYLWCDDTAGNYGTASVGFTVQTNTNMSISDLSPNLVTKGMNRTFKALYVTAGATNVTGNFSLGSCVSIPGSGAGTYNYIDWINSTHYALMDTSGIGVYLLSGGARVSGCAISALPTGLYCRDGATCYIAYVTSIYTVDLNTCVRSLVTSWTLGGAGFVINKGIAKRSDGKWWVGASGAATTVVSYPALLNSDFTLNTILNSSVSRYLYGYGFDGVQTGYFYATNNTADVVQFRESDGDKSGLITLTGYAIADIMLIGNRMYVYNQGSGMGGLKLCYADINFSSVVSGATCTLGYEGSIVPFAYNPSGYYTASVIENNSDHSSATAVITCTAPGYQSKSDSLTVKTNNWITPINLNTGAAFTILPSYPGNTSINGESNDEAHLKCVKTQLESNSLTVGDEIDFYYYIRNFFSPSNNTNINMTLRPVGSGGQPDINTFYASCLAPYIGYNSSFNYISNCTASANTNMTLGTDYYVCARVSLMGARTIPPLTGNSYVYNLTGAPFAWTLLDVEFSITMVTANTDESVYSNISGYSAYGYISDCGNQSGLQGVSVKVTQNNATDNFEYDATTDINGYFSITGFLPDLTSTVLFSKDPGYTSISQSFVLTNSSPTENLSTCLVLLRQSIMRINTQWSLSSNLTGGTERIDTWSDWRPNMTTKKDTIISGVDIYVEDTVSKEGVADIGFSESNISTTCSFSTAPTAYYIIEKGGGFYYLQVEIGGTNYTNLYAFCEDGDYFDIYYRSAGIDAHGRLDFISYEMRLTNVNVLVNTLPTYSWAYAFGDFYYETGDNKNIPVENLSCQMRLEQTSGSNITAWQTASISTTGVTQASYNFTFLSAFPPTVIVHFICNATGFTNFEKQVTVQVGTDAMTVAFCYITDANGLKLDWNKVGAQVRHWCEFKSYKNASLISMQVKAKETASSTERILKYSYDSANIWFFATDLFNDDMAKGLHEWRVTLYNTPSGVKQPNITYYQFVKVYFTPPEKVSADYCDDSNCPKVMYRGTNYVCKLTTKFEAEYTKIIMGVKLNDSTSLISLTPTDNFNPTTQIHETVITIPSVGEGVYGIKAPTKIQCYAELYIDQEHLIYGATPTQMVTQYKHEFESDVFGLQKFLNEFTQSDNPMETGVAKIAGIPAWFFSKIAVTDENGNLNPVLAIMYLIAFALIIALVIVFVNTRQQGGGQGGGAGKYGRPQGYLRIGGKRY